MRRGSISRSFVQVSRSGFACIWLLVFVLHTVCFGFYTLMAAIYWGLADTALGFEVQTMSLSMGLKTFKPIAVVYGLVGVCHIYHLFLMMAGSLCHHQLAFRSESTSGTRTLHSSPPTAALLPRPTHKSQRRIALECAFQWMAGCVTCVGHLFNELFGRYGLFGVEGKYFDQILLMRKLVELILQSVQAYNLVRLVSRPWLARSFVALLVFNCWSSPLLHTTLRRKATLQRMLSLICDIVLDFASTVAIHSITMTPYIKMYDPITTSIPVTHFFDETWFTLMANEFRLVFVTSWFDLLSRIVFAVSILTGISDVKLLLQVREDPAEQAAESHPARIKPAFTVIVKSIKLQQGSLQKIRPHVQRFGVQLKKILMAVIVLYGVWFAILNLYVENLSVIQGCRLKVSSWYTSKAGCALMKLSCYQRNFTGEAAEIEGVLDKVNPNTLGYLSIRYCPASHISPSIKRFPELIALKIYNSTIVEWGDELPRGVLSPQFPSSLRSVNFIVLDVKRLPANLGSIWPSGLVFFCEVCQLKAVPEVLLTMEIGALSLAGNQITEIPPELLYIPGLMYLNLEGNPITTLPEASQLTTVGLPLPNLLLLALSFTQFTSFSTWMNVEYRAGRSVVAGTTPLCDNVLLQGSDAAALWMSQEYVLCDPANTILLFPLAEETQHHLPLSA